MHPDIYKRPLLFCLAALIILLACFYSPAPSKRDVFHSLDKKTVTLTGRAEGFAVSKKKSKNVIVKVFSVDGEPADGYVYARLRDFEPEWKDTLEITGRLQKPYGIDLLGNFDWSRYLAHKNVFTEIKSSDVRVIQPAAWPFRAVRAVRADILRVFNRAFEPELAGIAGGVLLGERGELSPSLYTAFQDSGAIHLLVASGGNVGFVTLVTVAFCSLFGAGRKKTLLIALAVAGVYTLIAGADAPLVRAYFMAACACAGYFLGRNSGVFQGLIVSCFIILCFHPASVFETGFQMSFLATLAIIVCLNNFTLPAKWPAWVRFFAQIFLATLSTQLVLLPVFTNVFYKVSLTGLVSNMILVPMASLLMGLSFAYYVLTLVHAGFLLYWPALWCLEGFKALVEFFASFRFSALPAAAWSTGAMVSFYAALFWLFNLPLKNFARKTFIPCLLLVVGAPLAQAVFFSPARVYLLNEWNKNAAVVRTPAGETFVLGDTLEPEKLSAALYKTGVTKADAVLLFSEKKSKNDLSRVVPVGRTVRPFADVWPGDELVIGGTRVLVVWGRHQTREGRFWTNRGYSGSDKDDVSYCLQSGGKEICIGAHARFAQAGEKTVFNIRNKTAVLKI